MLHRLNQAITRYFPRALFLPSLAIALPLLSCQPAFAATYYVSVNGQDTNTGLTSSAPLATLSKACSLAKSADTVKLNPGIFKETAPCSMPDGVTIQGTLSRDTQGVPVRSRSTVILNLGLTNQRCVFPVQPNEILFDLAGKKNLTLSNLYLDGNKRQTGQAISVDNDSDYRSMPSNVRLENLAIVNFAQNAVRFRRTTGSSLTNSYILNSSTEYAPGECNARGYSQGNIALSGGSTNVAVDGNRIITTGFYGYGIDGSGTTGTVIKNNVFDMNADQLWNSDPSKNFYYGNFNIEFFGGRDQGVRIEGNEFDATISLVTSDKNKVYPPYRFLVKDNLFDIKRDYAIEIASSGIHAEGNLFMSSSGRGYGTLRNFGSIPDVLLQDLRVTGNTMDGPQFSFFHSSLPVEGLIIEDNKVTFRDFGGWRSRTSNFISGQRSASDRVSGNVVMNEKNTLLLGLD